MIDSGTLLAHFNIYEDLTKTFSQFDVPRCDEKTSCSDLDVHYRID